MLFSTQFNRTNVEFCFVLSALDLMYFQIVSKTNLCCLGGHGVVITHNCLPFFVQTSINHCLHLLIDVTSAVEASQIKTS